MLSTRVAAVFVGEHQVVGAREVEQQLLPHQLVECVEQSLVVERERLAQDLDLPRSTEDRDRFEQPPRIVVESAEPLRGDRERRGEGCGVVSVR